MVDGCLQQSLFDLERQAELVVCLEVAEHIDPAQSQAIAQSVAAAVAPGGTLIWSAAHPSQGGTGHINCQPKDYWAEQLQAAGLERDEETEERLLAHIESGYHMGWFRQNAMVLRRRGS